MKPTGDRRHSDQVAPCPVSDERYLESAALPAVPSTGSVDTTGAIPQAITRALQDYASVAVVEIVNHIFHNRCSGRDDVAFEVFTTLSDTALARVDRFERKRTARLRIQDLSLGLYVAEPDGIWTPIGTVSDSGLRISDYRRGINKEAFCGALESLQFTQLVALLDTTLSKRHLLHQVLGPFIKVKESAAPLRRAARARGERESE